MIQAADAVAVRHLTVAQAAARLGCSSETVRRLVMSRKLRALDISAGRCGRRRRFRIRQADLEAFEAARMVEPRQPVRSPMFARLRGVPKATVPPLGLCDPRQARR